MCHMISNLKDTQEHGWEFYYPLFSSFQHYAGQKLMAITTPRSVSDHSPHLSLDWLSSEAPAAQSVQAGLTPWCPSWSDSVSVCVCVFVLNPPGDRTQHQAASGGFGTCGAEWQHDYLQRLRVEPQEVEMLDIANKLRLIIIFFHFFLHLWTRTPLKWWKYINDESEWITVIAKIF